MYWAGWVTSANNAPPSGINGLLWVSRYSDSAEVIRQTVFRWGTAGTTDWPIYTREKTQLVNSDFGWSPWRRILTDQSLGDGLRIHGDKISVPEYSGATASTPGTSGLVPPAGAGEQSKFFTGGGTYKEVLTPAGSTLTGNLVFPVNEDEADIKTLRFGVKTVNTDGSTGTFFPIRVIPGTAYGRGLVLCTGGPIILGGGESAQTFAKGHIGAGKLNGETEYTYITSDSGIEFCYGQNAGYDTAKKITISAAGDMAMPGKITASGGFKGNADNATKLTTARTIALSGDVTASGTFDGSGNLTLTAALKNSGATAGAYGPGANATPAFNATFSVPQITVDAKGRVTAAATRTVKIPANPVATQSANGLLSAADKKKLDGLATGGYSPGLNGGGFHVASNMSGNFQGIPLPAGGTWRYAGTFQQYSSSYFSTSFAGDAAGGTTLNISGKYFSLIAIRIL